MSSLRSFDSRLSAAELSSARKVEALADEILEIPAGEEWDYEWDNHTIMLTSDPSINPVYLTFNFGMDQSMDIDRRTYGPCNYNALSINNITPYVNYNMTIKMKID